MRTPILADNAEMLASAYRNLSAAQKESRTEVVQRGVTLVLSSWRDGRIYRNSMHISFRDEVKHDKYSVELRDLIAVAVIKDRLIVQADGVEMRFDIVDELPPVGCQCPPIPF